MSALDSASSAESMATASCVQYGHDDGEVVVNSEVDAIWKGAHDCPSEAVELDELLWALGNTGHVRVDGFEKPDTESRECAFVPGKGVSNLLLRLRPNQNSKGQWLPRSPARTSAHEREVSGDS